MADLRTIEAIEYGTAYAARITLTSDICAELSERYIAFDTETTGLDPEKDRIVELGAVMFENGAPAASFQSYVNPGISIPSEVSALNHITNEMLQTTPAEKDIYPEFLKFLGDAASGMTVICGHVAAFDMSFLCGTLDRLGMAANFRFVDTRQLAMQIGELEHHSLAAVAEYFDVPHENAHHAREDALTSGRILREMLDRYRQRQ
ncbi:MAG: 3'-5' exonuclease [Lachnospiraceae bacterium]|nr:3'-5' exonuclease [Blautia sp.]MBR1900866.1 3'-5' exonuclease [Lachnospiraceae bacterium]